MHASCSRTASLEMLLCLSMTDRLHIHRIYESEICQVTSHVFSSLCLDSASPLLFLAYVWPYFPPFLLKLKVISTHTTKHTHYMYISYLLWLIDYLKFHIIFLCEQIFMHSSSDLSGWTDMFSKSCLDLYNMYFCTAASSSDNQPTDSRNIRETKAQGWTGVCIEVQIKT